MKLLSLILYVADNQVDRILSIFTESYSYCNRIDYQVDNGEQSDRFHIQRFC